MKTKFLSFFLLSALSLTFCKIEEETTYKFNKYFKTDETIVLNKILNYFDGKIKEKTSSNDIEICYKAFCDSTKTAFKKGFVSFDTTGINKVLTMNFAKNNIWSSSIGFKSDSLRNRTKKIYYDFNFKGKYFEYLKYYSKENDKIKKYYDNIIQIGGLGPNSDMIMLNCESLDFNDENIRLIFAIHWITYFSNYL